MGLFCTWAVLYCYGYIVQGNRCIDVWRRLNNCHFSWLASHSPRLPLIVPRKEPRTRSQFVSCLLATWSSQGERVDACLKRRKCAKGVLQMARVRRLECDYSSTTKYPVILQLVPCTFLLAFCTFLLLNTASPTAVSHMPFFPDLPVSLFLVTL